MLYTIISSYFVFYCKFLTIFPHVNMNNAAQFGIYCNFFKELESIIQYKYTLHLYAKLLTQSNIKARVN